MIQQIHSDTPERQLNNRSFVIYSEIIGKRRTVAVYVVLNSKRNANFKITAICNTSSCAGGCALLPGLRLFDKWSRCSSCTAPPHLTTRNVACRYLTLWHVHTWLWPEQRVATCRQITQLNWLAVLYNDVDWHFIKKHFDVNKYHSQYICSLDIRSG